MIGYSGSGNTQDSGSYNTMSQNKWITYPQKYEEPLKKTGWVPTSVKSPFEAKPGMKMSTYGGDKRKDKLRHTLQDSYLGSRSPRNSEPFQDYQDSIMQPSMDEMDLSDVDVNHTIMPGDAPFTQRRSV